MNWHIHGFSEQGLGTNDADQWLHFFMTLGGWTCRWSGPGQAQPLWPEDSVWPTREWLLARPGSEAGAVRLYELPAHATQARPGAASWDSGGFFDIDLRVHDLADWYGKLRALGWGAMSEPVDWPFGELQIREWLARGPDEVVVALVQRLAPPADPPPPRSGFSNVFNASQTVRDFEASLAFYEALGFQLLVRHEQPLGGRGGEMLGLDPADAPDTVVQLAISSPTGIMDGSVEIVALPQHAGKDLADDCEPGQRGLNSMRFPVRGLDAFEQELIRQGVCIERTGRWSCEPYGTVRGIALRSPDGAWLEFFETGQNPL